MKHTVSVSELRVSGSLAVQLSELLEVVHRELVSQQMQKDVLKSTTVSDRVRL